MKAMVLNQIRNLQRDSEPLQLEELPEPVPQDHEILIRVYACGVCHTELDEIEGRTPPSFFPIIPGHQVVGRVEKRGEGTRLWKEGERVGVGWIFSACGECGWCVRGEENLCADFRGTGRDANGGYAQFMIVPEDSAHRIPDIFSDSEAAPLLCAGAVGYRSLRLTGLQNGQNLGFTGFGASAHIVLKIVRYRYPDSKIFVFARSEKEREFARELGAFWTGDTREESPEKLHCLIDTTPVWKPILEGLRNLEPGGRLVVNAIRKENLDQDALLGLDYARHIWMEKEIKSVANVTRKDIREFLELAAQIPIRPEIKEFELEDANRALMELKDRRIRGAKVLRF
jgi:propanol-preferring alcohol dehydrogenase